MNGPLDGFTIIELAGIGPGPYAGQLLADLGANVINIQRPSGGLMPGAGLKTVDQRGKKSLVLDLRKPGAVDIVLNLVQSADALIEGNRPGVTERLGIGPEACHAVNAKLVYGRMTGWGQTGPWAKTAGHDINYLSITGALEAMGRDGEPPLPPLNFVGDYGGGTMNLVMGVLAALLRAQKTGQGDIVDAAIIDGVSSMMGIVYSLSSMGLWSTRRSANLLDGAMPYYRCYRTQDEAFMAVGCIEPQFFAKMLALLDVDPVEFGAQNNPKLWAEQHARLEAIFATRTRDEWAEIFDGTDACVSPVLNYEEATHHPQNNARGGLNTIDGRVHPRTIPAFKSRETEPHFPISAFGADTADILSRAGYSDDDIQKMASNGLIFLGETT